MGKKGKIGKDRKDKFYKLAKETGFRARSAFKLIQLNRKFGFLQQSQVCIDLCAAPGGWMQVAKQNMPVSSIVIGVDLFPIRPIPGCIGLVEDITTEKCKQSLTKELQSWKADVVLHDGAPNVGKSWIFDAYQQICLTLSSLKLATCFLKKGGWFVTKVFRSKDYNALLWVLKQLFKKIHATKPSASRKESAEIFVVCQGYLAPDRIDPRFLDSKYVFEELDLDGKKNVSLLHPEKQKRIKAEGYSEKDFAMRNELLVKDFMESPNGLSALQGVSKIVVDDKTVLDHPKTTFEILECCKDIKVLGRKEIKSLLLWHKQIKEELFKTEDKENVEEVEEEAPSKPLTQEELEDMEFEELDKQITELREEESKDLKRKKRKTSKAKAKLNEKMNLNMVIKGDEGPKEEEHDIFDLRDVKTVNEMEKLQDVSPDFIVEENDVVKEKIPKFKKYDKDSQYLDDDGLYDDGNSDEEDDDIDSEEELNKEGLGLSDDEENVKPKSKKKGLKVAKPEEHPLIKSGDFRDKDTRRQHRVQLWFEKENLQNVDSEEDEDYDLKYLSKDFKKRGVEVLGGQELSTNTTDTVNSTGKKSKRKADLEMKELSSDSDSDTEDEGIIGDISKDPKQKKIRLNEEELALGAMMIKGRKAKRDLIDAAWNRYTFNDDNLPSWFVQDEEVHMKKPVPVPQEIAEEYKNKVRELNVRPIKKVMEAKARKKRRFTKRLEKAKKHAEKVLDNADSSAQEKIRQIKKLYKKAEDKKKETTYVVAKKHTASKRAKRPAGVKGRYQVVDPRQKKDKRSVKANNKRSKKKK